MVVADTSVSFASFEMKIFVADTSLAKTEFVTVRLLLTRAEPNTSSMSPSLF